jgi:hypothetical protein
MEETQRENYPVPQVYSPVLWKVSRREFPWKFFRAESCVRPQGERVGVTEHKDATSSKF